MYWTAGNLGTATIERASMDGKNRQCLHSDDLGSPSDLTLDYQTQILYWADYNRGTIESSSVDGSNKSVLINLGTYSNTWITIYEGILYWSKEYGTDAGIWSANVSSGQVLDTVLLLRSESLTYSLYTGNIQLINEERQYECKLANNINFLLIRNAIVIEGLPCNSIITALGSVYYRLQSLFNEQWKL